MKLRTIAVASLSGLLFCACGLQEPQGGADNGDNANMTIRAGLVSVQGKTWLDYAAGGSPLKVYWSDGDRINVNGQNSLPVSVGEGEKISEAGFLLSNLNAPYRVIYPSSAVTGNAYDEDGSIEISLPSVQAYSPSTFANGAALMYGCSESVDRVQLSNLCAVVRVNIKGDDNIVAAKLISDKTPLCGDFRLTPSDGSLEVVDGQNCIILEMADKVAMNNDTGTDFFFAIPEGYYSEEDLSFYFKSESEGKTMQNIWRPDKKLEGGKLYSFNEVGFEPTAKEIDTAAEWNEFAAAFNAGSDISGYLFKDNVVRLGADISADDLTPITAEFDGVLDGNGYTLTRNAATAPLFASITGEVRNLVLGGTMTGKVVTVDERPVVACAPLAGSLDGGKISGCINRMAVAVGSRENFNAGDGVPECFVGAHVYASGLVAVMTAGTIENSVNEASVDVAVNVDGGFYEVSVAGIVADVRLGNPQQEISLAGCRNRGALTLSPALTKQSKSTTTDWGMQVCGFGGVAGWLRNEGKYVFENCDNEGNITLDGYYLKHAYGNTPFTIAVGGVLGLAAPCPGGRMVLDDFETYDVTLTACSNLGRVYNCCVNYSSTKESNNKVFTGGLAGALMGTSGSKAKVEGCESMGAVITYDYTSDMSDVTVSGRPAYCPVAGGLVGYGGYLDIDDCTVQCQIGNGKRQMVAWGGVIGYTMRPFDFKNSTLDVTGFFQRIEGYKMNRAVVAVIPVKYNTTAMNLVPDVAGSSITGNDISCQLWTSGSVAATTADGDLSPTLTLNVFSTSAKLKENLVCGQGFTANTGVTIGEDNTYL